MTKTLKTRWWQVGVILPWLMAVVFACDIVGRFMPLELVAFRTFEPSLRKTPGVLGEFEPGKITHMHRAYGDLAAIANTWRLRQYHEEEFHADDIGFRNAYDIFGEQYAGIVAGDSFTVSSAVPESDTLSGKLTELAGARFYNAGWSRHLAPGEVAYLSSGIKIRSGVVVCEVLERIVRMGAPPLQDITPGMFTSPKAAEHAEGATTFLPWLTDVQQKLSPSALSPIEIISRKIVKRFQNGKLQPNPYWNMVVHETMTNGDDMLFLPMDLAPITDVNALSSSWAEYFEWYEKKLQQQNLKLVVLLVPNKYTVYGPLAKFNPPQTNGDLLLGNIQRQLQAKGIPVVDVTAEFRVVAAERLPQHKYLYWRDDTHWNADGIAVAAGAVWSEIRMLSQQPGAYSKTREAIR